MVTETKPCIVCRRSVPVDGPSRCEEHGAAEDRDNDKRYATVDKPISNETAGLMFWQQGTVTFSTYRTNHTRTFCRYCWFAHSEGAECPVCAEETRAPEGPPVIGASDDQMRAAGWSRSLEEHEQKHGSKRGRAMASKKKNGEANGTSGNEHADKEKIINHTRNLRCAIPQDERIKRGELMGRKMRERDRLDEERKSHSAHLGGQIKTLDAEVRRLNSENLDGFEYRDTRCQTVINYRTNTVKTIRVDTGETIDERAATPEEMEEHKQVPIQAKGANEETAKPEGEKPKRARKKKGEDVQRAVEESAHGGQF